MKKSAIIIFIAFFLMLTCCSNEKTDFKVVSTLHSINFTYQIKHIAGTYKQNNYYSIRIKQDKEQFFNQLKDNQYYLECYGDNVVLFKDLEDESAYFIFSYYKAVNELHEYICKNAELSLFLENNSVRIDFPLYVLDDTQNIELPKEVTISCSFDYILQFYQRMENIIVSQGEEYIVVKSFIDYQYTEIDILIEKTSENTIRITENI